MLSVVVLFSPPSQQSHFSMQFVAGPSPFHYPRLQGSVSTQKFSAGGTHFRVRDRQTMGG